MMLLESYHIIYHIYHLFSVAWVTSTNSPSPRGTAFEVSSGTTQKRWHHSSDCSTSRAQGILRCMWRHGGLDGGFNPKKLGKWSKLTCAYFFVDSSGLVQPRTFWGMFLLRQLMAVVGLRWKLEDLEVSSVTGEMRHWLILTGFWQHVVWVGREWMSIIHQRTPVPV